MFTHSHCRFVAVAMLLALGTPTAQAAFFCVGTETELRNALATAQSNGDTEGNIIDIEEGTITITGSTGMDGPAYDDSSGNGLLIYGGYDGTCLHFTGGETVLDADHNTNLLHINAPNSSVFVGYLTFLHGTAGSDVNGASALYVNANEFELRLNKFIGNSTSSGTTVAALTGKHLLFNNNLFVGNSAPVYAAAYANISDGAAGHGYVISNTIIANHATDSVAVPYGLYLAGGAGFFVSNNILWSTSTASAHAPLDLAYSGHVIELHNNDIGAYAVPVWNPANSGNLSVDPDFAGLFSFELAPTSPLVNAGLDFPPCDLTCSQGYDLAGQPRVIGQSIDIGAYESDTVFSNGFQ